MLKLSKFVKSGVNFFTEHSNAILTSVSVISTVYAVYRAIKDAPNCKELLDEMEAAGATNKEKAVAVAKTMAPTVIATGVSVASTVANGTLNGKKIDSLLMKYQLASSAKDIYQQTTKEIAGEEIADKIEENVAKKRGFGSDDKKKIFETGNGTDRCALDFGPGIEFYSDVTHIATVGVDIKDRILNGGETIFVNEALRELDLQTRWYDVTETKLGWHPDWFGEYRHENFFNFRPVLDENGKAYTMISFAIPPKPIGNSNSTRYHV